MAKANYDIGYGKPPESGKFKPGQSGNPKGRPKSAKNLKTELEEELLERISIKEQGKVLKVSKQRAMLKALTARAMQGDPRAATVIVNMVSRFLDVDVLSDEVEDLTEGDKAILERFEKKVLAKAGKKEKSNGK
ncbi:MAG: hypothetical protein JJ855_00430 [Rhodospirillales bacterium]|nr:hypothetical protein [Rhodospirillales bacterium]